MYKGKWLTIPNILSAYRLLSFPMVGYFIIEKNESIVGILICVNLITDILDGFIARTWNMQTKLGSRLDSLADIGTYILVFWSMLTLKRNELGDDFIGVWLFLGLYLGSHVFSFMKFGIFPSLHLYSVKITGYLQGIYFFILFSYKHISACFWISIIWGMIAWLEELIVLGYLKKMESDAQSIFHLIRRKK